MKDEKVKLSGKCTIQVDTGKGTVKTEIPKSNPKTGDNNADGFIKQAFHFAIMRHGAEGALAMLKKQAESY